MTHRRKIQLVSLSAAVVLILAGTSVGGYLLSEKYRGSLEYVYQRALSDLGDSVSAMESTLSKAVWSNTAPQQNGIAFKLMREASAAKTALSALPLAGSELSNVNRFLAQAGDYSQALSSRISRGEKLTGQDFQNLENLRKYAAALRSDVSDVQSKFSDGSLSIGEREKILNHLNAASPPALGDSFEEASEDFTDYPTLIYDGPFSDHIGQRQPKALQGEKEIPQGNAQVLAAEFLGVPSGQLSHISDTEGNLPTCNFTLGDLRVSVTKAGGRIASFCNPREIGESRLDYPAALAKAREFFSSRGISGLQESYYVIGDNKCTLNFAYTENGVICYPDLIKVSVALDNGEIVEYNASGFLMNHTDREKPSPKLTQDQAQKSVSPRLRVEKGDLAIIPTAGLSEVLCYEFLCSAEDGTRLLVYINASAGYEEQILLLLSSPSGVLTR